MVALFEQGAYNGAHGEFAELKAWLIAKLLWNPDQDVNVLIDDFMTGYYGAAAPYVKEYLFALHKLFENPEVPCRIFDSIYTKPEITDEFLQYAELLWYRAESAVKDDPALLYNVRMSKIPVVYSQLQRMPKNYKEKSVITSDKMIKTIGAPVDYIARASQLITLLDESKEKIYIRENHESESIIQDKIRSVVTGSKLLNLKSGKLEADLSPQWGGSIVRLRLNSENYVKFNRGGINIYSSLNGAREASKKRFNAAKQDKNVIALKTRTEERSYAITKDALTVTSTFKTKNSSQTLSPIWRIPLTLGRSDSISWRSGEEKWKTIRLKPDAICDTFPMPVAEMKSGTLEVAGASSLQGVKLNFDKTELLRIDIEINRSAETVILTACTKEFTLEANQSRNLSLTITPVPKADGLEKSEAIYPTRIVFEDEMLRLKKPGEWCERINDPKAVNFSTIKLFNTHYEWCTTMPFKQVQFKEGMRYKLRMRVRVEAKAGVIGNALWAGVYDPKNKKSYGRVTKKTDFFKDHNYIWLDVAEWIPADYHYFWIGPGCFDKEKDKSAIEALYIDRIEMVEM